MAFLVLVLPLSAPPAAPANPSRLRSRCDRLDDSLTGLKKYQIRPSCQQLRLLGRELLFAQDTGVPQGGELSERVGETADLDSGRLCR